MAPADLESWGWRIPFLFGVLIGPIGIYIRNNIDDATAPPAAKQRIVGSGSVCASRSFAWCSAVGAIAVTTSVNYLIVYMPTYVVKTLKLPPSVGFRGGAGRRHRCHLACRRSPE